MTDVNGTSALAVVPQQQNAIMTPNIPSPANIDSMWRLAQFAHRSQLSKAKTEYDAFFIISYGWELGISPMVALRTIYSVNGTPTCSGELMLALIRKSGKAQIRLPSTEDVKRENKAVVWMKRLDSGDEYTATFTMQDAEKAGLAKGKDNWQKFPHRMLFWRAVSDAAKSLFSDVISGLYTVEEIAPDTPVDESGVPIGDIITIETPKQKPAVNPDTGEIKPPHYLTTQDGQARLKALFDELNITSEDHELFLSTIEPGNTLSRFGETTLSEAQLHTRIREIHTGLVSDPPTQPKGTMTLEEVKAWAIKEGYVDNAPHFTNLIKHLKGNGTLLEDATPQLIREAIKGHAKTKTESKLRGQKAIDHAREQWVKDKGDPDEFDRLLTALPDGTVDKVTGTVIEVVSAITAQQEAEQRRLLDDMASGKREVVDVPEFEDTPAPKVDQPF